MNGSNLLSIVISMSFFSQIILASDNCNKPQDKQAYLESFFDQEAKWIEVQDKKSRIVEKEKTIKMIIDFDQHVNSKITSGKEAFGNFDNICVHSSDSFSVNGSIGVFSGNAQVSRDGNTIEINLTSPIIDYGPYYLRKSKEVKSE